jgi:hypothetical protein
MPLNHPLFASVLPWIASRSAIVATALTAATPLFCLPDSGARASTLLPNHSSISQSSLAHAIPGEHQEAAIATEINRVRRDPSAYADWLETLRSNYDYDVLNLPGAGRVRTVEGVNALDSAIAYLRSLSPLPPLQWSPGIAQAAEEHLLDLSLNQIEGQIGSDGSTLGDRLRRYGQWSGEAMSVHSYGGNTAENLVLLAILSDGDPDRRSRTSLLSRNYEYLGIACGMHPTQDERGGKH